MSESNTISIDAMSREELIARARELSINRPELMTRVELRDEIVRLTETDEERRKRARGWLGVARDLVASVVEQRLNLPDAAELIRGANLGISRHVPPVATVTLAEIYAAQGHLGRAIKLLDEVLLREPDHAAAEALREALVEQQAASKAEPAVRQSDMPEPHDISEPWEGDPIAAESADNAPAEAEAMAAAELDSEVEIVESANQPEISGVATVVSATSPDEATASCAGDEVLPWGTNPREDVADPGGLPRPDQMSVAESSGEPESAALAESSGEPAELSESAALADEPLELPIPDLPNVCCDELLLYRRGGRTLVAHWEVQRDAWEQWQARQDGEWVLRVFQVRAVEGPLESEERDVALPGMSGEVLFEVEPTAQVRLAVGWKSAEHFQPIVIGVEVAGNVPENLQLAWHPLPSVVDPPAEFWLRQACQCWHALSAGGA